MGLPPSLVAKIYSSDKDQLYTCFISTPNPFNKGAIHPLLKDPQYTETSIFICMILHLCLHLYYIPISISLFKESLKLEDALRARVGAPRWLGGLTYPTSLLTAILQASLAETSALACGWLSKLWSLFESPY